MGVEMHLASWDSHVVWQGNGLHVGYSRNNGLYPKDRALDFEKLSILGLHVVVELLWICDVWSKKINRECRIVDSTQVL